MSYSRTCAPRRKRAFRFCCAGFCRRFRIFVRNDMADVSLYFLGWNALQCMDGVRVVPLCGTSEKQCAELAEVLNFLIQLNYPSLKRVAHFFEPGDHQKSRDLTVLVILRHFCKKRKNATSFERRIKIEMFPEYKIPPLNQRGGFRRGST